MGAKKSLNLDNVTNNKLTGFSKDCAIFAIVHFIFSSGCSLRQFSLSIVQFPCACHSCSMHHGGQARALLQPLARHHVKSLPSLVQAGRRCPSSSLQEDKRQHRVNCYRMIPGCDLLIAILLYRCWSLSEKPEAKVNGKTLNIRCYLPTRHTMPFAHQTDQRFKTLLQA